MEEGEKLPSCFPPAVGAAEEAGGLPNPSSFPFPCLLAEAEGAELWGPTAGQTREQTLVGEVAEGAPHLDDVL